MASEGVDERYRLPPGKDHLWDVTVRGEVVDPIRAPSWYYAREKACKVHNATPAEVTAVLREERETKKGSMKTS